MTRIRTLALTFTLTTAAVLASACDPISGEQGGNPIGIMVLNARTTSTGYTTGPQAAFFRVTSATFISVFGVTDTCITSVYTPSGTSGSNTATTIGAGAELIVKVSGRTDTLTRTAGASDPTYRSARPGGIPFVPGDTLTVEIPGDRNGFPTATFTARTAEPFTATPITTPAAGQAINVTWTAATDANSAMYVQFRYATGTATTFNRQVSCSFRDDGTGTIPSGIAQEYVAATLRDAQPIMQRVRTVVAQINTPLSYFNLVSEFDRPTPVSP